MPDTLDPKSLRKGDKVTLRRKHSTSELTGEVVLAVEAGVTIGGDLYVSLAAWDIVSVERAKPTLPTTPGFYISDNGGLYSLLDTGQWRAHTLSGAYSFDMSEAPGIELSPLIWSSKAIAQRLKTIQAKITSTRESFETVDVMGARGMLDRLIEELGA